MSAATNSYRIRVQGHIDPRWSAWFDGMTITHATGGASVLTGRLRDQAELYGLLLKLQKLNLPLLSLDRMDLDCQP